MGYPKALLPLGNETFISHILAILERGGLGEPRIVLGRDADLIAPGLVGRRLRLLVNQDPGRGQFSSMKLALSDLAPDDAGCMFWPVDQPGVEETIVRGLIRLFHGSRSLIVLPACTGKRGHPAIFRCDLFEELIRAPLEGGPKGIVVKYAMETAILPCEDRATIDDVDTPEDYFRLTGESLDQALHRHTP
jgi:molybdenum cofactor cytidylyltransferase